METFWQATRKGWFAKYEKGKNTASNLRLYLSESLLDSSRMVISGARLRDILNYKNGDFSRAHDVGQLLGSIDYFWRCWREFHEAETAPPFAIAKTAAPPAKSIADDVRCYFPDVATIHGSTATDANALHQLTVWLLHWAERHGHQPASSEYSLAGRLRSQQAVHPNAGKFLKACRRLHEALLPLTADEPSVKQLLGKEYGPNSRTNLTAVLRWWASWIKEQQLTHDDPAGAYLAALRRVPVVEEWENGSPRYNLPTHLGIYDEFEAEITPLRQAFEASLPDLSTKKKRALRAGLHELLSIDRVGMQRRREQFEQDEYGLDFLPADYPALRFDVAGQAGGFKWQWVSPMFWGGINALLQYKQLAARAACEQLAAVMSKTPPTASSLALSPTEPTRPISALKPPQIPYFHISPEGITRQLTLRNEARNAGRRQAICNVLRRGLMGQQREDFEREKRQNNTNVDTYSKWLETKLFYRKQELSVEERQVLEKTIDEEAIDISTFLPYSDNYSTHFITKLKAEPLLRVAEFLQFTREPWYAGLAGFYLLNKADDIAYFRDLITEHLERQPEDATLAMFRAVEWLNAEIERLAVPGSNAFRVLSIPASQPEATIPESNSASLSPADLWTALLWQGVVFSLSDLDRLLASTGLVEDAVSLTPTADFRGAALVGILEALRQKKYLKRSNNAKLAALLAERYGRDVANPNTIGRNYPSLPAAAQLPHTRALALLPAR